MQLTAKQLIRVLKFQCMASKCIKFEKEGVAWSSFPCSQTELRIDITLDCGQSFRLVF